MKIYNPLMNAPWQELSCGGLGFFVVLSVGWKIDFFVRVHWAANPAVYVSTHIMDLSKLLCRQLLDFVTKLLQSLMEAELLSYNDSQDMYI